MAIVPVEMVNGASFTVSGTGSNIITKNSTSAGFAYSADAYTLTDYCYYEFSEDNAAYTSTAVNSGDLYASFYNSSTSSTGNAYQFDYDDSNNKLIITMLQDETSDYGNKYFGLNSTQTSPTDQGTATTYLDNHKIYSVRESGTDVHSLNQARSYNGNTFKFSPLSSASPPPSSDGTRLPPPPIVVRF